MTRYGPIVLLAACLLLGYCYGVEKANGAKQAARVAALTQRLSVDSARADSALAQYRAERRRADSVSRLVPVRIARRDRAVASTDSVLAQVDSVLSAAPTPAQGGRLSHGTPSAPESTEMDSVRQVLRRIREAVIVERLASDSVISSLQSVVEARDRALAASDSLIASLQAQVRGASELISEYERRANPSLMLRTGRFLRAAAIGAAAMAVLVVAR